MKLAELRDLPLPTTSVAETAWDKARIRRRRHAAAGVTSVLVMVVAASVGVAVLRGNETTSRPSPSPATRSPDQLPDTATPLITDLPDYAALAASAPTLRPHDATALSTDPVRRAVLAVAPTLTDDPDAWFVVNVLGDDGRWRFVDVPGLDATRDGGGHQGYALRPTSLSVDGTQLALPQLDRLVVVDLTSGEYRSYEIPGFNTAVVWQDGSHVAVTSEEKRTGRVVNLVDGTITASEFTANTGFAPDGSWVTWGRERTLTSSDGSQIVPEVANGGGVQLTSPLVNGDAVVGLGGHNLTVGDMTYVGMAGVAVVDRVDGRLRAFLYTEGPDSGLVLAYLMAVDSDSVTVAVAVPPDMSKLVVVRWSMRTGEVTPVAMLPVGMLSGSLQ